MKYITDFFIRTNWTGKLFMFILVVLIFKVIKKQMTYKGWARFNYAFFECAPYLYPVRTLQNTAFFEDGSSSTYFDYDDDKERPISGRWGETWGYEHKKKALMPEKLELDYISLMEKKFYKGIIELPKETLIKTFKKFEYQNHEYLTISIGYAPGGVVIIWVVGQGHQLEVGRYQLEEYIPLKETTYLKEECLKEDKYIELLFNNIDSTERAEMLKVDSIPFGYWDKLRPRYNYTVEVDFPEEIIKMDIEYFNREKEVYNTGKFSAQEKAVLADVTIGKFNGEHDRRVSVYFDDEEILNIFKILNNLSHENFHVKIDLTGEPEVIAYNHLKKIKFEKCYIKFRDFKKMKKEKI